MWSGSTFLKQHLFTFLMGLNPIYESVKSQLLRREKMPSLEDAIGAVKQAESCFKFTPESQVQNSAALLTKKPKTRVVPSRN